jgi:hypothetical protein
MASIAVFLALGGGAYALTLPRNSVRSKHIKNGQVKRPDVARNAIDSRRVRNRSLLAEDFAPGQLPAGTAGPVGAAGQDGAPGKDGATGSPAGSLLTGNTTNVPANVGVTHYLHPSGPTEYWGAHTFADMLSPNTTIVARDLALRLANPPGAAGEYYKMTFQLDSGDTPLTCTITGTVETSCGDSEHTVTIPPRSRMSLELEVSAGSVSRRVMFGWRAVTP